MRYDTPLIEGRLRRRYKRFLADVEVGGDVVVSHCPNPGSMKTCAPEGARVWLSKSDNPHRKLAYTWELCEAEGTMVFVHPGRANDLVAEALVAGRIRELAGYDSHRREVRLGAKSRIDFFLRGGGKDCYLEVKNATLDVGDDTVAFPDAVTERGTRHLRELIEAAEQGFRTALLFCCARTDSRVFRPCDEIDPVYGQMLRQAASRGVEILAYGCSVTPEEVVWQRAVRVDLREPAGARSC